MYSHYVQYYETDKMGVTHHSNYIRFMEEARVEFFKNIGFDYFEFEKCGIVYERFSTKGCCEENRVINLINRALEVKNEKAMEDKEV